jgi:hypothetical protein
MGSLPVHWGSSRPDRNGSSNCDYGDRTPDHWFDYSAFDDKSGDQSTTAPPAATS